LNSKNSPDTIKEESRWSSRTFSRLTAGRSTVLLAALILMYAYIPLSEELHIEGLEYVFIAIIAALVLTVSTSKTRTIIAVVLTGAIVALTLLTNPENSVDLELVVGYYFAIALFIGYAIAVILYEVTQARSFHYHLITSALSAYLLIGMLWAILYSVIEVLNPGSFSVSPLLREADTIPSSMVFDTFVYFSLITLTTVGYGDISPVSPIARSVATIQPIVGQLLLAVLVAWLVGKKAARRSNPATVGAFPSPLL
jgi:hypothetical protein